MTAYYNENDPKAAAWLRELIKGGHIAAGDVDERSIEDVIPNDLRGYTQCHFFAGIGGWSYALRLAGWPDDRPVWTGSCPCQPFSAAGQGKGFADERHLWPSWFHLVRESRPAIVFGEQVANALPWFDLVQDDLENEAYAVAAAIIGAHSVGAPHIRQRLYWVADADGGNSRRRPSEPGAGTSALRAGEAESGRRSLSSVLGHAGGERSRRYSGTVLSEEGEIAREVWDQLDKSQPSGVLGHAGGERLEVISEQSARGECAPTERGGALGSCWSRVTWLPCRDGTWRPVEPGSFPLAHGVPGRVGLLRGYGNAIVPQVAAAFIEATGLA